MKVPTLIQSRLVTDGDIGFIRELIEQNPSWSRYRLSRELAERWNWRNGNGLLKDIACRSLLRKLDERGLIHLPPPRVLPLNRFRHMPIQPVEHDTTPIVEPLAHLQPLQLLDLSSRTLKAMFAWLLARYHYLILSLIATVGHWPVFCSVQPRGVVPPGIATSVGLLHSAKASCTL
ncbi:MAG: hypothetical protein AB1547_13000 [Thermodesulfobacteriota bacterium]